MLLENVISVFLLVCLGCFFTVNLHNILKSHKLGSSKNVYAEVRRPLDLVVGLAAVGTLTYFLEVIAYLFLVFTSSASILSDFLIYFQLPFALYLRILGLLLTTAGYFLLVWSVLARGRYAVSWEMPTNQKLVTWGPYNHIRHPSYSGYFLMFLGFFLLWSSFLALIPLAAIPGYYKVSFHEEELLMRRFGEEYIEYQKKTGRFIPRFR